MNLDLYLCVTAPAIEPYLGITCPFCSHCPSLAFRPHHDFTKRPHTTHAKRGFRTSPYPFGPCLCAALWHHCLATFNQQNKFRTMIVAKDNPTQIVKCGAVCPHRVMIESSLSYHPSWSPTIIDTASAPVTITLSLHFLLFWLHF